MFDKISLKTWGIVVLLIALLALIGFGIAGFITGKQLEGVSLIIGVLIATVTDLKGFFWGSSSGSKDKDAVINSMTQNKTDEKIS